MNGAVLCTLLQVYAADNLISPEEADKACIYADTLISAAQAHSVTPQRLVCLAKKETSWTVKRGRDGECGITQVLPGKKHSCAQLSDPAYALQHTAYLISPSGPWARIGRRSCVGRSDYAGCITRNTLIGYNAGTKAARGAGKRYRRGANYAATVLSCEERMVKITPPKFHKEVPVAEAKAGDIVYFYSEKGGYRFGVLRQRRANSSPPTMTILPTGRHSVETVPASHVHNAFRDDLNAKETL